MEGNPQIPEVQKRLQHSAAITETGGKKKRK